MKNIWNVGCLGWGIFGMSDAWDSGCWDVGCWKYGMLGMWNVWDVRCSECATSGMYNVWDVQCCGYGMFRMWNVRDMGCSGCGILVYKMLHLKIWFLVKNSPIHFHINSTRFIRLVKKNMRSFSSSESNNLVPPSVLSVS